MADNAIKFGARRVVGTIVALGDGADKFYFVDTEIPESLPLGGAQLSALHQFPGPGEHRTVDVFGYQPDSITFSGELFTLGWQHLEIQSAQVRAALGEPQTAIERSNLLDRLCKLGKEVHFRFDHLDVIVIIREYRPVIHHESHVSYSITLEPVRRVHAYKARKPDRVAQAMALAVKKPAETIWDQFVRVSSMVKTYANATTRIANVVKNMGDALTKDFKAPGSRANAVYALAAMIPGVQEHVIDTTAALVRAGDAVAAPFVPNLSRTAVAKLLGEEVDAAEKALQSFNDSVKTDVALLVEEAKPYDTLTDAAVNTEVRPTLKAAAEAQKRAIDLLVNVPTLVDPETIAYVATQGAQVYAALRNMERCFGELAAPVVHKEVLVQNPDLYKLALEHYGDVSKWTIIAVANGWQKPTQTGNYKVLIPVIDPEATEESAGV